MFYWLRNLGCGLCLFMLVYALDDVIITTKYGRLRGQRLHADFGLDGVTSYVDEFLGIPFAQPPVGARRWRAPEDPLPWKDIHDATTHGSVCPQNSSFEMCKDKYQDEDCLYLNIYSPFERDQPEKVYPVMFYVHGGSYFYGSGNRYNGSALAQYGVVVVAINYRLFALGFLSTGDDNLPGNYGLLDQIQALKWVKENIHHFRGDPNSVTIYGNSAGGSSVALLMMSPLTKGLFHAVISHSGTPNCFWATETKSNSALQQGVDGIIGHFSCAGGSMEDQLNCLRKQPWQKLTKKNICKFHRCSRVDTVFKPVPDGHVLPGSVQEMLYKNHYHHVPYMAGVVTSEFKGSLNAFSESIMKHLKSMYDKEEILTMIKFKYTDWSTPIGAPYQCQGDKTTWKYDISQILSDVGLVAPTNDFVNMLASHPDHDVYLFVFHNETVYHSVDLNYVFGVPFTKRDVDEKGFYGQYGKKDKEFSKFMMRLWSGFARNKIPSIDQHGTNGTIKWNKARSEYLDYLYMSKEKLEMRHRYKAEKVAFWNVLLPNMQKSSTTCQNNTDNRTWVFLAIGVVILCFILALVIYKFMVSRRKHTGSFSIQKYGEFHNQSVNSNSSRASAATSAVNL